MPVPARMSAHASSSCSKAKAKGRSERGGGWGGGQPASRSGPVDPSPAFACPACTSVNHEISVVRVASGSAATLRLAASRSTPSSPSLCDADRYSPMRISQQSRIRYFCSTTPSSPPPDL
jgi:hypothetical protein